MIDIRISKTIGIIDQKIDLWYQVWSWVKRKKIDGKMSYKISFKLYRIKKSLINEIGTRSYRFDVLNRT